ncbi:hypothetical protein PV04_05550 [Phialophora macrospora]|uniref:Homeobox domain-containing protein n=1 Tax=Phialophora macrospora TaxID=1851006 RepID=A0A0D2FN62_9EURO|nr:hypothetical protein PV04_05550 [Phialophora macrospora]
MAHSVAEDRVPSIDGFSAYGCDQPLKAMLIDVSHQLGGAGPAVPNDDNHRTDHDYEYGNDLPDLNFTTFGAIEDPDWLICSVCDALTIGFCPHEAEPALPASTDPTQAGPETPSRGQAETATPRRLTKDQKAILDTWLSKNLSYPYPSTQEKVELAAATCLSTKQIEHWFARTRQRKLPLPDAAQDKQPPTSLSSTPAQLSLEVLPASPADFDPGERASEPNGDMWDDSLGDVNRNWNLANHQGDLIHWWLSSLPAEVDGYQHGCRDALISCRRCLLDDQKLCKLAVTLASNGLPPLSIQHPPGRALLRILDAIMADGTTELSLQPVIAAFSSFWQPMHPPAVSFVNWWCHMNVEPAFKELISPIRQCLREGTPFCEHDILQILVKFAYRLKDFKDHDEAATRPTQISGQNKLPDLRSGLGTDQQTLSTNQKPSEQDHPETTEPRTSRFYDLPDLPNPSNFDLEVLQALQREDHSRDTNVDARSIASRSTAGSAISACSYTSFGPRRGRKRPAIMLDQSDSPPNKFARTESMEPDVMNKPRVYTCSLCGARFSTRYLWRRHSESVHAPDKVWMCQRPNPSVCGIDDTATPTCWFCTEPDTNHILSELCPHGTDVCWAKPAEKRTFYRRDHLKQHLRGYHKATNDSFALQNPDLFKKEMAQPSTRLTPLDLGQPSTTPISPDQVNDPVNTPLEVLLSTFDSSSPVHI